MIFVKICLFVVYFFMVDERFSVYMIDNIMQDYGWRYLIISWGFFGLFFIRYMLFFFLFQFDIVK